MISPAGLALMAVVVTTLGIQTFRIWTGRGKHNGIRAMWLWPVSRAAKNAIWRAHPAVACLFVVTVSSVYVSEAVPRSTPLGLLSVFGMLFFYLCWLLVMWFNQPRFLVPPKHRPEWGLWRLNRRRRKIRRAFRAV
jgi:protein-S-isoprenylcysteine O-methyltransferase Ste14